MQQLLSISIAVLAGLLLSRLAKKLNLPAVTAYLIAGILIGPYVLGKIGVLGLGFTSSVDVKSYSLICDVALGFIAFDIGNEFRLSQLKQIGKQATIIAFFQAVTATIIVDAVLILLHLFFPELISVPCAIILGAIATATAPAATLMVVRQYKAEGPLTKILLPIVALDDAIGLVVFAVSFGIARALLSGGISVVSVLVEPLIEVVGSLILGGIMGAILSFLERFFHSNSKRLSIVIAIVFITVALSMLKFNIGSVHVSFSSLLVCMMLGTVFCNVCDFSEDMMSRASKWTAPLFVLFFVLSGAELELNVFTDISIVIIGVVYIIARSFGKCFGATVSAKLTKCEPTICKYLGVTLLPQAGVALGMSLTVSQSFGEIGLIVRNITLFAVLIYECFGPMLTKIALTKAGEISEKPKTVKIPNKD